MFPVQTFVIAYNADGTSYCGVVGVRRREEILIESISDFGFLEAKEQIDSTLSKFPAIGKVYLYDVSWLIYRYYIPPNVSKRRIIPTPRLKSRIDLMRSFESDGERWVSPRSSFVYRFKESSDGKRISSDKIAKALACLQV
jgi:hypothetical protein